MKEKNIKFIMELIFIFILSLLFILPNVSINNSYVYDNDGNFETSSKKLQYESIVYSQYYKNYLDFNQLLNNSNINYNDNGITIETDINGFKINGTATIDFTFVIGSPNFYKDHKYFIDTNGYYNNLTYFLTNYGIVSSERIISFNNDYSNNAFMFVFYSGDSFTDYIVSPMIFDLTQIYGLGYEPSIDDFESIFNLTYYDYILSKEIIINGENIICSNYNLVKSPFIYIKDLISGFLNIDKDNITFNIVIDYTCIWFLMFILWHLVYCLFDFIIHLIRIKRKE